MAGNRRGSDTANEVSADALMYMTPAELAARREALTALHAARAEAVSAPQQATRSTRSSTRRVTAMPTPTENTSVGETITVSPNHDRTQHAMPASTARPARAPVTTQTIGTAEPGSTDNPFAGMLALSANPFSNNVGASSRPLTSRNAGGQRATQTAPSTIATASYGPPAPEAGNNRQGWRLEVGAGTMAVPPTQYNRMAFGKYAQGVLVGPSILSGPLGDVSPVGMFRYSHVAGLETVWRGNISGSVPVTITTPSSGGRTVVDLSAAASALGFGNIDGVRQVALPSGVSAANVGALASQVAASPSAAASLLAGATGAAASTPNISALMSGIPAATAASVPQASLASPSAANSTTMNVPYSVPAQGHAYTDVTTLAAMGGFRYIKGPINLTVAGGIGRNRAETRYSGSATLPDSLAGASGRVVTSSGRVVRNSTGPVGIAELRTDLLDLAGRVFGDFERSGCLTVESTTGVQLGNIDVASFPRGHNRTLFGGAYSGITVGCRW